MKRKAKSPLRVDPTRTATLRRKFLTEIRFRFNSLRKDVYALVAREDAFGIKAQGIVVRNQVLNQRYRFYSRDEQAKKFQDWLRQQYTKKVLTEYNDGTNGYWRKYIDEGFKKGSGRAFDDVKKPAKQTTEKGKAFYAGGKDEFLRSSFGQPESIEKVKLLASRVFTELQGATQTMATKMNRVLVDGLVQGKNPLAIARDLTHEIDITRSRAETIARTELIRAHAEGQLDALEALGVTQLGVMVEMTVTDDEALCPECEALSGIVITLDEAQGLIPVHPNCRCAYMPANVGESEDGQIRGKAAIDKAIGRAEKAGADLDGMNISRDRPEALVDSEDDI